MSNPIETTKTNPTPQQPVWDLFVRIFHWSLVAAFTVAFYYHDSEWDRLKHAYAGYTVAGLLVSRIIWGFMRTGYASFRSFPFNPIGAIKYIYNTLTGHARRFIGHNPAGSIVIYTMLVLGLTTVVSGYLVINDGWLIDSPYLLRDIHFYASWSWLGLVVMHIIAVVLESVIHKDNLIRAMITGCKRKSLRKEKSYFVNKLST
jgi:cytochrome b